MKNMTKYAIEDETEEVENLPEFKQGEVFALSNPEEKNEGEIDLSFYVLRV
jgi:hypothetical protein